MRHPKPRSLVLTALLLTASVILFGCFTTTLNLGSADAAKVDVLYCGDWHFTWQDKDQSKSADLIVRNFDGKSALTEMDALVAYLQMLGAGVDFKLYDEKANLR